METVLYIIGKPVAKTKSPFALLLPIYHILCYGLCKRNKWHEKASTFSQNILVFKCIDGMEVIN